MMPPVDLDNTQQLSRAPLRSLAGRADHGRNASPGFTIVEFLVLIGILMILVSIFLPYLLRIRENDRRVRCQANLGQLGNALRMYAESNGHVYPRVVYDEKNFPNGYICFTGIDDPDPFSPASKVKPNDITASLWLLVRLNLVDPSVFICPSAGDSRDLLADAGGRFVKASQRGNFRHANNLSYSYCSPFSDAPNYRLDDNRLGGFALMADKSPGVKGSGDSITGPAWDANVLDRSRANSRNHGKAGQNVLYAQGYVLFERTAYCGVGQHDSKPGDNIYTALASSPLVNEQRPAEANGFWANDIGPAWQGDSYLVPTADEGPDSPPVLVHSTSANSTTHPATTQTATTTAPPPVTTAPTTKVSSTTSSTK